MRLLFMKLFTNLKQRHGFSLAELIIYLGILGISAGIFGGMLNTITSTQVDQFNQNEVSGQLNFAVQTMQRYIRDASIIQSDAGVPSSTLVLQMPVSAQNPTTFYLQNNRIYLQQGATGTPQAITNDKVSVDSLVFNKFAQPASKDVVQIDIAISQTQPNGTRIDRSLRSAVTRVNAAAFDSDLIPNVDASYNIGTYPSARWLNGSFSGQVSAGSLCFGSDCRTSWAQASGVTGSGSVNYIAKWNTASTINASTLLYDNGTNVGIGAINPLYKLDVQGGQINSSGGLCINGDCKTAWSQVTGTNYWTATGTSIYYNSGNVGVGTANPGAALEVMSNSSTGWIKLSTTSGNPVIQSTNDIGFIAAGNYPLYLSGSAAGIAVGTGYANGSYGPPTNGAIIQGNVGIGTTSPAAKLQVASSTNTEGVRIISSNYSPFIIRNSADTADLFRVDQNGNVTGGTGNASAWTRDAVNGYLYTSTLTDKVGIGTASPVTSLTVNSPSGSSHVARFRNGDANRYRNDYSIDSSGLTINAYDDTVATYMPIRLDGSTFQLRVNGGNTNTLYLDGSGNVGIGTVSQDAKLQVAGNGTGFARIGSDCGGNYTAIGLNGAFSNCSNYSMLGGDGNLYINRPTGGLIYFRENNATQLTIASGSGNATFTGSVTASAFSGGSYAGTISSANVSSGAFGANTGGGNYSFPGNVGIGTMSPTYRIGQGHLTDYPTRTSIITSTDIPELVLGTTE
ncbi:MAG: hypothetical protein M1320_01175, partial [Patescibacteria group bacterium]|nr:hypothetical protein [Patescibacteria group bacterium]